MAGHARLEPADENLISLGEAAKRLGVDRATLRKLIAAGKFPPAVEVSSTIYVVSVPKFQTWLHGDHATEVHAS